MTENEIIIVDGISPVDYKIMVYDCVRYAIISLPFTVDRMRIPDVSTRALNIAKGKVAEELFRFFCEKNDINIDFETCNTPFWTTDQRDFVLFNQEWDIKNNFFYCRGDHFDGNYINFPALVPNRFEGDQWSKRNQRLFSNSNGTAFLFTFLKNATLVNGQRGNGFLEITLSESQLEFLNKLYEKYQGQPQTQQPFSEDWFWGKMGLIGGLDLFRLNFMPPLIIAGYANADHWQLFKDTGPFEQNNHFRDYLQAGWYGKYSGRSCNFMKGTLWTTIKNATLPVSFLPSFLSLFPHLKKEMKHGRIKS